MTKEQRRAIKRICRDYDFENFKELKDWVKETYGDTLNFEWFTEKTEEACYEELEAIMRF